MKRFSLAVLTLMTLAASPLAAQGPQFTRFAPVAEGARSYRLPETHWQEGAAAGALVGAVLVALYADGMCRTLGEGNFSCGGAAISGGLIGAAMGFAVGGLVGGLFPK